MTIDTSPDALERLATAEILLVPHDETVAYVLSARKTLLAIAAEKRAQGWQPIETAPKDGTVVDLWAAGERMPDCFAQYQRGGEIRWFDSSGWHIHAAHKITHWMPRPKPPEGV